MQNSKLVAVILTCAALASCQKKSEATSNIPPPCAKPDATRPASPSTPAVDTPEAREIARKQAALEYATQEDEFLNDAKGQWAVEATATSSFGETRGAVADSNQPRNMVGKPDTKTWTNDRQDLGFDSFETVYEKPVHATAVRVVITDGVEALSKVELRGATGAWSTAWSGLSDVKRNPHGPRTWFVRTFEKTAQPVQAVRVTIANNVDKGYKHVDAVQLVGE
jgi:hypothetical protein